jgi:signal transduction histidine kinase/ligand-binding sensor domain-containing protein/DNA-binding response OmpR family regulator
VHLKMTSDAPLSALLLSHTRFIQIATRRLAARRPRVAVLKLALIASLWAMPWHGTAFGHDYSKAITQYARDVWQTEQGLPQNSVQAIVQTRDGYLWLGTQEGLVRFDGARFTVFDKRNTPAIRQNHISSLLEGRDGCLWIGTNGGLVRLKEGQFSSFTSADGLSSDFVTSLCEDREGNLWAGTFGKGLNRFRDGRFTQITTGDGLANEFVWAIAEDGQGNLWIGTNGGLDRLRGGRINHVSAIDGNENNFVWAIRESQDGSLWVGTSRGLVHLSGDKLRTYSRKDGLPHDVVKCIFEDHEGILWVGTDGGGLSRCWRGAFTSFGARDGLTNDFVQAVYEDREGSLWIGTYGGGLNRLRDGKFSTYTAAEGLAGDQVRAVLESRDGSIWIGTNGNGVSRFKDRQFTNFTTKDGLAHDVVMSLCEDRDGNIWLGTNGGLSRFNAGRFTNYTSKDGLSHDFVRAIHQDRSGGLWVGTRGGGLNYFKDGKFTSFIDKGVPSDVVRMIFEDHAGGIWFGGNNGLTQFNGERFKTYTTQDGLSNNAVYSMVEDSDGTLWIGTYGSGLNRFKDGVFTVITSGDGLFDDVVFQILDDGLGNLWMTCNKGVFAVSKQQLNEFAAGKIAAITSVSYGIADGMKSAECNGSSQPAGWRSRDGSLWFPTLKGVAVVNPRSIEINRLIPPVLVESVLVDQRPISLAQQVSLPPGKGAIEFHYTGLSFLAPDRVKFKYQLEGFDQEWVDAGSRRVAYYTNIPPGRYRFRVIACNNDGVWNYEGATFAFSLKPHFYQTTWFYTLCLLAVILAALALYMLRIRQVRVRERVLLRLVSERTEKLRQEVAERERAQEELLLAKESAEAANKAKSAFLANVSHEIRTPMNGILGMTDLALETAVTDEQREYLSMVKASADSLLTIINDILDFSKIEAGKLTLDPIDFNLRESLDEMFRPLAVRAQQKGLKLLCEVSEEVPEMLVGDLGRLRQVLINLVGNAIKFTNEGTVTIGVFKIENGNGPTNARLAPSSKVKLRFTVSDTGIGIPADKQQTIFEPFLQGDGSTTRRFGGTGLGLAISSRLLEMMGGQIAVQSEPERGSTFHFTVCFGISTWRPEPGTLKKRLPAVPADQCLNDARPALHVLLAEDNVVNQKLAMRLLERRGYKVTVVETGAEALSILETEPIDLILMDVQMPVMDGLETTAAIRRREINAGGHIPIIAITAHAMKGDRERCLRAGMDGYVSKPIDAGGLFAEIDRLVNPDDSNPRSQANLESRQSSPAVFDRDGALTRVEGDFDLLCRLISLFLDSCPRVVAQMRQALDSGSAQALERAAHTLKGAAASIGAGALFEAAAQLEKTARTGELTGAHPMCDSVEREFECLRPLLEGFIENSAQRAGGMAVNDDART